MLLLVALFACTPDEVNDTAAEAEVVDTEDSASNQPTCDTPEIRVNGDDPPAVGDEWGIFLWCDDTLLTGATVVRFDPPEIAELYENNATFVEAGDAMLYMQVGRYNGSRAVTVSE